MRRLQKEHFDVQIGQNDRCGTAGAHRTTTHRGTHSSIDWIPSIGARDHSSSLHALQPKRTAQNGATICSSIATQSNPTKPHYDAPPHVSRLQQLGRGPIQILCSREITLSTTHLSATSPRNRGVASSTINPLSTSHTPSARRPRAAKLPVYSEVMYGCKTKLKPDDASASCRGPAGRQSRAREARRD
jgi:hypothetical protein